MVELEPSDWLALDDELLICRQIVTLESTTMVDKPSLGHHFPGTVAPVGILPPLAGSFRVDFPCDAYFGSFRP